MNKPAIAIIEDEIPAARLLHSMIARLRPEWDITVIPGSVEEATEWFATHPHPDLLFLDIQLADGNSFDFLSAAHPSSTIIFTTAYDQYAVRAFTVNSIDYILKPIDEQRLQEAIDKYEHLQQCSNPRPDDYLATLLDALQSKEKQYRTRFLIYRADRFWSLQVVANHRPIFGEPMTFAVTQQSGTYIKLSFEYVSNNWILTASSVPTGKLSHSSMPQTMRTLLARRKMASVIGTSAV